MNFRRCYGGSRVGCDPGQCILGRLGRKGLVPPARSPSPLRVVRSPLLSPRISALLRAEARVSAPASVVYVPAPGAVYAPVPGPAYGGGFISTGIGISLPGVGFSFSFHGH